MPASCEWAQKIQEKNIASAGNRTRINCLEGSYADHYTTDATCPGWAEEVSPLQSLPSGNGLPTCHKHHVYWGYSSVVEQSAAVR